MIQSVGMTKHQLRSMLILEGLFYTVLTLVSAYGLSALGVGVVVRAMVAGGYSTFRFTLRPLLFCTPILAALAVLIPWVCFHGIERQSIVERDVYKRQRSHFTGHCPAGRNFRNRAKKGRDIPSLFICKWQRARF